VKNKKIAIIGAGPAGLFCAHELLQNSVENTSITIFDKGKSIDERINNLPCSKGAPCNNCQPCNVLCGFGGSGMVNDGKLIFTSKFGGNLQDVFSEHDFNHFLNRIRDSYLKLCDSSNGWTHPANFDDWFDKAANCGFELLKASFFHLGSDRTVILLRRLYEQLKDKVQFRLNTSVVDLDYNHNKFSVTLEDSVEVFDYVIVAPGRFGNSWLNKTCISKYLSYDVSPLDIGLRLEFPAEITKSIASDLYEFKLKTTSKFGDTTRNFCFNDRGHVCIENNNGVVTTNGYSNSSYDSKYSNMAILVSINPKKPFKHANEYLYGIAKLANYLSGDCDIVGQKAIDFIIGKRSTELLHRDDLQISAFPGNFSMILPYRVYEAISEFLIKLERFLPGILSNDSVLYGTEIKTYSQRLQVGPGLQTKLSKLYIIGDGSGLTRGLVQASMSGLIVGEELGYSLNKEEN